MRFITAYLVLAIALTGINADITAFNGDQCDGDEGENVACDDACSGFTDRHSFRVGTYSFINIH